MEDTFKYQLKDTAGTESSMDKPFWQTKSLAEMTDDEWESLCDGCAKCCLVKLEDDESNQVAYTNLACSLLDMDTCRCRDYQNRSAQVPDCLPLKSQRLQELKWLPDTCAYRLLYEGKPLESWHPLVSGDAQSVHRSGTSVLGKTLPEDFVHPDDMAEHIIHWVE